MSSVLPLPAPPSACCYVYSGVVSNQPSLIPMLCSLLLISFPQRAWERDCLLSKSLGTRLLAIPEVQMNFAASHAKIKRLCVFDLSRFHNEEVHSKNCTFVFCYESSELKAGGGMANIIKLVFYLSLCCSWQLYNVSQHAKEHPLPCFHLALLVSQFP